MSPEDKIQQKFDQMDGVSECYKCKGSGEIAISVMTAKYLFPGPVQSRKTRAEFQLQLATSARAADMWAVTNEPDRT